MNAWTEIRPLHPHSQKILDFLNFLKTKIWLRLDYIFFGVGVHEEE